MTLHDAYGYLLVHFVEDAHEHAEKVYFSLSIGDDPLRWRRLGAGRAVLESTEGTSGVRDPFLVRRRDGAGFHLLATDLRVWRRQGQDWEHFTRHGSRDLVVWDSTDLLDWSEPRYVEVAPSTFGMAWAPTVSYQESTGEYLVFFSGKVFAPDDVGHDGDASSAVHVVRTRDFAAFTSPLEYLAMSTGVIDLVAVPDGDLVHVIAKHDDGDADTQAVFHQVRRGYFGLPRTVATRVGSVFGDHVEGPLLFKENDGARWFLWVDQYGTSPQRFHALTSRDPASGDWTPVPDEDFQLPPLTKHGSVLSLTATEHAALDARWPEVRR